MRFLNQSKETGLFHGTRIAFIGHVSIRDSDEEPAKQVGYTMMQPLPEAKRLPFASGTGTKMPRYRIEAEVLGTGGQGEVMSALQDRLQREVAVKRVRNEVDDGDGDHRLVAEARITAALEHPNIVPVHDLYYEFGRPNVVMSKVAGSTLEEVIQKSEPITKLLEVFLKVCDAIAFAHDQGIVHLDIKPANILVGDFGKVFVVDWGLATKIDELDGGSLFGTLGYLAPEMLPKSNAPLGVHTDVYLLGATLFHIIEGHAPHQGRSKTGQIAAIEASAPSFSDSTHDYLKQVCRRAMEADVETRTGTVEELRNAVARYFEINGALKLLDTARDIHNQRNRLDGSVTMIEGARETLYFKARFAYEQCLAMDEKLVVARAGLRNLMSEVVGEEIRCGRPDKALVIARSSDLTSPEVIAKARQARDKARSAKKVEDEPGNVVAGRLIPIVFSVWAVAMLAALITAPAIGFLQSQIVADGIAITLFSIAIRFLKLGEKDRLAKLVLRAGIVLASLGIVASLTCLHHSFDQRVFMVARQFFSLSLVTTLLIVLDIRLVVVAVFYALFFFFDPADFQVQLVRDAATFSVGAGVLLWINRSKRRSAP